MTPASPRAGCLGVILLALVVLFHCSAALASHSQYHGRLARHRRRSPRPLDMDDGTYNEDVEYPASEESVHRRAYVAGAHPATSPATNPVTSLSTKSSDKLLGIQPGAMKMHDVYVGFIIEGPGASMEKIMKDLGVKPATYGRYAQVVPSETFNGRYQLLALMDDVKKSGAVFQPAIMVQQKTYGFTWDNDKQAVAVAKVLAKFTDEGIPVWMRFMHEMNWYTRDGTYNASPESFKEAWAVMARACRKYAPKVLLWWSPNIESTAGEYEKFAPDNFNEVVDVVGVDWYPRDKKETTTDEFLKVMKPFHDKYASPNRPFALGEAGLHYEASHQERVDWLEKITLAKKELPNFLAVTWYNCEKERDYKLVGNGLNSHALREKLS